MKTIDHDPNEPPKQTTGEAVFVTVVTVIVLSGLALGLKWVFKAAGIWVFGATCAAIIAICFAVAFWLQARTKRNPG